MFFFFVCVAALFFFREKKKDAILSLSLDVPFFFPLPLFFFFSSMLSLPFSYHKFSLRAFCCFYVFLLLFFFFFFFDVYSVAQFLSPSSHSFSFLSSSLLLCSFTTQD